MKQVLQHWLWFHDVSGVLSLQFDQLNAWENIVFMNH